jgi:hypothetical protein
MASSPTLRLQHKRGDTFRWAMSHPEDPEVSTLEGWVITSQVREADETLVASLTVSNRDDAARVFVLSAGDTTAWPLKTLYCDIQYTDPSGVIRSSPTILIDCVRDITRPA